MKRMHNFRARLSLSLFLLLIFQYCRAIDVVKITQGPSAYDVRSQYTIAILDKALLASTAKYGPYEIHIVGDSSPLKRAIQEVHLGEKYNLAMGLTTTEWENKTIAIRIPIRRGILNYRLLTVNTANLQKMKNISSIEDLKHYKVGLRRGWATTDVLKYLNFNIVHANSYDGVFNMLSVGRADYIPRGIHEIYDEIDARKPELDNLAVLPGVALYIPAPCYVFVSPAEPRLAERIQFGLEAMIETGELKSTFNSFYGHYLRKAELDKRRIIYVGNPLLPTETPLENTELWLSPPNQYKPIPTFGSQ